MITEYKSALYRISYQGVSMIENALGNPNLIQISVVLGCSIIVSPQQGGGIQYLPNGESRKWFLYGVNTKLNKTGHHFIYARLNRDGDQAYLIFSVNDYAIDGTINGENPSPAYCYVKVGEITETDALEGATTQRKITFDFGKYQTDETREENYWQLRSDSQGNEYIITKYPVLTQGSLTQYATLDPVVPSIFEGIPYDNQTIWFNPATQRVEVIGGTGGGEAGSVQWDNISGKPSWIEDTKPSYSWSDITGEKPFYTKEEIAEKYVTIDTEQEISGLKHFTPGLSVGKSKKKIYEEEGVVYIDADVAVTGAMTFYASAGRSVSTIMDGVTVDEETITKGSDNVLRIKNAGAGSSFDKSAMWTALAGSTTEQINKSHLTTALTGYATESWVSGKNYAVKATTLAGYGITDAPTKTGSGASGTWGIGITGNAATASKWATARTITLGSYLSGSVSLDGSANVTLNANVIGLTSQGNKTAISGTTMPAAGVRLYQVYNNGYPVSFGNLLSVKGGGCGELLLAWKNTNRIYYRSRSDVHTETWQSWSTVAFLTDNVASATKLQTARTIWGQSFDGTKPVTGALTSVTDITGTGTFTGANLKATDSVYVNGIRLHKTADGVITLDGNLAVTGGVTMYAIDPVSASTIMDGVVVDGTTIKKENGKLVAVGGGEAGSVAWGNISGKPSVFATNIANITDLHSSWDAVLKAQKPNWLTAVSIATISDLHANWDALLKAAPSAYVTRWPTISEVTGKQNLVVKLNGGTTEGTNQFTYNATGAKTINITPAGIGAAASSHNHSWSNITSGKPTTLAGYGITDAPTKTGSGASGTWAINITGTAGAAHSADSAVKLQNVRRLWGNNFDGTTDVTGKIIASNGIQLPYRGSIVTQFGNLLRTDYSEGDYNDFFELTARGSGSSENKLLGGNSGLLTWSGNRFIFNAYRNGWYIEDSEYIKTYGSLYVPRVISCSNNIECGNKLICTTLQAKELDIAYGTNYKFVRMGWNETSGDFASFYVPGSTSQWFTMELRSNGFLYTNGNILAEGGGTYYGSDIRYKSIMQQVNLSLLDIAKAPSFVYHWNKQGMKRDRLNLGGSAQYTQSVLPWAVEDNDNFLSMDYATVAYTFAVHTARHLLTYESRTDKKIKKLEREIVILKKQLKKLGYEEVRTLDDQSV